MLRSIAMFLAVVATVSVTLAAKPEKTSYQDRVLADAPVLYWNFDGKEPIEQTGSVAGLKIGQVGKLTPTEGARPEAYELFSADNQALSLQRGSYLKIADPGEKSPLDFDNGDAITLEAWVNVRSLPSGFGYLIGKGRTKNKGFAAENQNYALRLTGGGSSAGLSFLFRSSGDKQEYHRWTSSSSMGVNDGWHHVAVTYVFGKPESIRGYIDGEPTKGKWDMGGATDRAPVVDDDELWIGASMGGHAGSSFDGQLDEVAIFRSALKPETIAARYKFKGYELPETSVEPLVGNNVRVEIYENIHDKTSWKFRTAKYVESFELPAFGIFGLPQKYSDKGLRIDRSNPVLIRAWGRIGIPDGKRRILLRSRNAARLFMDGKRIAETDFHKISSSAHGTVFPIDTSLAPNIRPCPRGDTEQVVEIDGDGREHLFLMEMIVGGRGHRLETGETAVSIAKPDGDFSVLGNLIDVPLTDAAWPAFVADQRLYFKELNRQNRRAASREEDRRWDERHERDRRAIAKTSGPEVPAVKAGNNAIDRFITQKLADAKMKPAAVVDDATFLRRVTLDITGRIPTRAEIRRFENDEESGRRARAIDRLLNDPGWADHWVGYWQDVLAENPNIIKPTLNNTGPFRWWIYESFEDNKPFDRFATELIQMEGSTYGGGPAGFALATQNDVPMAAKAHVIGQAFLAIEMKCARCHDAPFHDVKQEDLFSIAAMLKRSPEKVPATSSIPGGDAAVASLLVEVTLKPGSSVKPAWSFSDLVSPDHVKIENQDTRSQLAALVTSPENPRFAQVIVNRVWERYLGRGIIDPVDDWENADPSHPELLDWLAREFINSGYDLKQLARLIFNSQTYQRARQGVETIPAEGPYLFAGPLIRRLSAEQIVDSMFFASGKDFDAGQMSLDIDGAMKGTTAVHLGFPRRAWEFASTANERDRPSLSLPLAQPFVTTLETFGWRSSRQNPASRREETITALQPAEIANGVLGRRLTRLSDDSVLTQLAIDAKSVDQLIEDLSLQIVSRRPTDSEQELFRDLLTDGFADRVVKNPVVPTRHRRTRRDQVSWSNHLNPKANEIKVAMQADVRRGDDPTAKLENDWRECMEDAVWLLLNSPEFVFVP